MGLEGTHVLIGQVEELLEGNSTVGEGPEGPLLLDLGGESGVGNVSLKRFNDEFRR